MSGVVEKKLSNQAYLRKIMTLMKDYFLKSNERYKAWMLLIGAALSTVALVALMFALSWWTAGFWAALSAKNLGLFIASMQTFAYIVGCYIGVSVLKNYLVDVLSMNWRNWLTTTLMNRYLANKNYLALMRHANQLDNPAQRIQEDVRSFVDTTLSLGLELMSSTLTLMVFIGILWVVGGSLSFVLLGASITIPGYLVWCALIFSGVASVITHYIGKRLTKLTHQQQGLEADFRKGIEYVNAEAENISQERGEKYHKQSLFQQFQEICKNTYQKILVKTNLVAFKGFYQQLSSIFPYFIAAPLFFRGFSTLGQLMQIAFSFQQVQTSSDWFINSYEVLATYKADVGRIMELDHALEQDALTSTKKDIQTKVGKPEEALTVQDLHLTTPTSTEVMMRDLNLTLQRGENTLIKGPSGLGKSTLFKVMADTWKYGHGRAVVPDPRKACFLPQKPLLPDDTLRAVLAYPEPVDTYSDKRYIEVLKAVGQMDQFIRELDIKSAWSTRLSPGQQQRISFARALLKNPEWLFLDETTASLDPASEEHLYGLLKSKLKGTTFISIAHRPSVAKFHDRVITLATDQEGKIKLNEQAHCNTLLSAINDDAHSTLRAC